MDLKSANILFNFAMTPKICDFGWACYKKEISKRITNESEFFHLPPENFHDDEIEADFSMDIWSLGIMLYEMIFKKTPFYSESIIRLEKNIK